MWLLHSAVEKVPSLAKWTLERRSQKRGNQGRCNFAGVRRRKEAWINPVAFGDFMLRYRFTYRASLGCGATCHNQ